MASTQSSILAPGYTLATSTDVNIASGSFATVGLYHAGLATPAAATFSTATTGGTLIHSTTYYYRVSAINANGESLASTEASQATGAGGGADTATVTVNWVKIPGATGYKVYGRDTGAELLIATVGDVATYIDTGSVTPAGALPGANTSASSSALSQQHRAVVFVDTPGNDLVYGELNAGHPTMILNGPGTYRVTRQECSASGMVCGVFKEI